MILVWALWQVGNEEREAAVIVPSLCVCGVLTDVNLDQAQVQLALKSKGLRDDITVLVIDALPSEELRTPPALQRRNRQPIIARWAQEPCSDPRSCLLSASRHYLHQAWLKECWHARECCIPAACRTVKGLCCERSLCTSGSCQ